MPSYVGFMIAKKNAIVKVLTCAVFLFRFYSVVFKSLITVLFLIPLQLALPFFVLSTSVAYSLGLRQYLLEIKGGQQPMIASFFILTG